MHMGYMHHSLPSANDSHEHAYDNARAYATNKNDTYIADIEKCDNESVDGLTAGLGMEYR